MAIITDTNAQWCSTCRDGRHGDCTSDTCECPDARKHRRRPGFGSGKSTTPRPAPRRRAPLAVVPEPEEETEPELDEDEEVEDEETVDVEAWGSLEEALSQLVEFRAISLQDGGVALRVRLKELG